MAGQHPPRSGARVAPSLEGYSLGSTQPAGPSTSRFTESIPPNRPQRSAARSPNPGGGAGAFANGRFAERANGVPGRPSIDEPVGAAGPRAQPAPRAGPSSNRLLKALQQDGVIPVKPLKVASPALSDASGPKHTPELVSPSSLRPGPAIPDRPGSRGSNRSSVASDNDLLEPAEVAPNRRAAPEPPKALQNALDAFEMGGRQRRERPKTPPKRAQPVTLPRGPTDPRGIPPRATLAPNAAPGRSRRTAVANQGFNAKPSLLAPGSAAATNRQSRLDDRSYPMTPGFRDIEKVLYQIRQDWEGTGIAGAEASPEEDGDEDRVGRGTGGAATFSPVALALDLLASEGPSPVESRLAAGQSLSSFLRLKEKLERALQLTIQANYRQFDASVGAYHVVRRSVDASQRRVGELRHRLTESREVLGVGSNMVGVGGLGRSAANGQGQDLTTGRGAEMKMLSSRRDVLGEMLKILEVVEQLRAVPDRLESLLSEKRFLPAVVLLVRSLKAVSRPQMLEIPGLNDLRAYLQSQEKSVEEILVEELHGHLYLKSFYTETRWRAYQKGQNSLPKFEAAADHAPDSVQPSGSSAMLRSDSAGSLDKSTPAAAASTRLQRYLDSLSLRPMHDPLLDEPDLGRIGDRDLGASTATPPSHSAPFGTSTAGGTASGVAGPSRKDSNPETDSFTYIESLVESLAVLGRLGLGLDAILQRVPIEIYNLVEATLTEVDERNEPDKRASVLLGTHRPTSTLLLSAGSSNAGMSQAAGGGSLRLAMASSSSGGHSIAPFRANAAEASAAESSAETLRDLFWTLYSKLDASLQGFRVLYEVAMRISERKDFKDTAGTKASNLLFSLLEVWKPIQSEVRALLHDYLTDDDQGVTSSRNPVVSVAEVLRSGKVQRDAGKQLYHFKDADPRVYAKELAPYQTQLTRAIKLSMPGLVTEAMNATATLAVSTAVGTTTGSPSMGAGASTDPDPRGAGGGTHRVLVRPDTFNISVLFGPTLAFLTGVRSVLPSGMVGDEEQGFGGFLDDFVLHVFLPQLEDKIASIFQQATGAPDAFQEGWGTRRAWHVPIAKSVSNLMVLIDSLWRMLQSTPFHREKYGRLIVSVISQYLQKCSERYRELVSRDPSEMPSRAAEMPASSSLKLAAVWADDPKLVTPLQALSRALRENGSLTDAMTRCEAAEGELGRGHVIVMADIISSGKKLAALGNLWGTLDCFMTFVANFRPSVNTTAAPDAERPAASAPAALEAFTLPLTRDMATRFQQVQKDYRSLADNILFALRVELRLRALYYLGRAFREGSYVLSASDATEPDPHVVDLNTALTSADEATSANLPRAQRTFVFAGLPQLLDVQLVQQARFIKEANQQGFVKMSRNVLALQQNLKTLGYDSEGGEHTLVEVDFERSRRYWDLALAGPEGLMKHARSKPVFRFDEYRRLLCLQCGIDPESAEGSDGAVSSPAAPTPTNNFAPIAGAVSGDKRRRLYNESLIELHTLIMED